MKKILSVMLAIMMLFGALSISASAAVTNEEVLAMWKNTNNSTITIANTTYPKTDYVVLQFNFNGGTSYVPLPAYDTQTQNFVNEKVSGIYLYLPGCDELGIPMPGNVITMPLVTPAEGDAFQGWYCNETGELIAGGGYFEIPEGSGSTNGRVYNFVAKYYAAESEGDTLGMILGVLMKVFGTIVGILFLDGSSTAGIELMEKMLGGLLG